MAARSAGFTVTVKPSKRIFQDRLGRFSTSQSAVRDAHADLAAHLARRALHYLEEGIATGGRADQQRSTGYLLKAVVAPENRRADKFGFSVGLTDYLDNPRNNVRWYYREVEYGSRAHIGDLMPVNRFGRPLQYQGYSRPNGYTPATSKAREYVIQNASKGYRMYTQAAAENTPTLMKQYYRKHFKQYGLDYDAFFRPRRPGGSRSVRGR